MTEVLPILGNPSPFVYITRRESRNHPHRKPRGSQTSSSKVLVFPVSVSAWASPTCKPNPGALPAMAAAGDPPEEQVTEHPVLEQFPNALPERARIWARSEEPSNSKEAGTRVANLPQTWGEKGESKEATAVSTDWVFAMCLDVTGAEEKCVGRMNGRVNSVIQLNPRLASWKKCWAGFAFTIRVPLRVPLLSGFVPIPPTFLIQPKLKHQHRLKQHTDEKKRA